MVGIEERRGGGESTKAALVQVHNFCLSSGKQERKTGKYLNL